jgi:hypothetical protein
MKYKIIDNFLDKESFLKIKNVLMSNDFPYYYANGVSRYLKSKDGIYFTHFFYNSDFDKSIHYHLISPIVKKLKIKSLLRIKVNMYPPTSKIIEHEVHKDYEFKHIGFLYYVNTNDGFTRLGKNIKIESIENRGLIFEPYLKHNSSTCTNMEGRININFNYL